MDTEDLIDKLKVKYRDGNLIPIHKCSMCGYQCGYFWSGEQLMYDPGCYCVSGDPEPRSETQLIMFLHENPTWVRTNVG